MRLAKLILGTLVLAVTLQPLLGQAAKMQINVAGSSKANKFDLARSSGFDFSQVSDLSRAETKITTLAFGRSNVLSLEPKRVLDRATPSNQNLCYSLRVYNFTREGTEAPRMTGSTTCTPANRAVPKSVDGSEPVPKVRYVPQ